MKPATPQGPFFTWSLQDGMRAFVTEEQQRVHWQTIKHDPRARYWKVEVGATKRDIMTINAEQEVLCGKAETPYSTESANRSRSEITAPARALLRELGES